jgi:hypothetical protein
MATTSDSSADADVGSGFVNRDRELEVIRNALNEAAASHTRLLLVEGASGIGKTRLLSVAERMAEAAGFTVAWGRAWAEGSPPFWPWVQILRSLGDFPATRDAVLARARSDAALAAIVPDLVSTPDAGRLDDVFALYDGVGSVLRAAAHAAPLLILVDDLGAADVSSLSLLDFVGRSLASSRLCIVATYDPGQPQDGERAETLARVARNATRLNVTGLAPDAVARMYKQITGEPPLDVVLNELVHLSGGNPYVVEEAIKLLSDSGSLRRGDHSLGFHVPPGARAVALRAVEAWPKENRRVLETAAVIGREFDLDLLVEVADADEPTIRTVIEAALASRILQELSAWGRFAFRQALTLEALYEETPGAERMRQHEAICQALERRHPQNRDAVVVELAHHSFKAAQAGDSGRTISYLVRAARRAAETSAVDEATRLYKRALRVASMSDAGTDTIAGIEAALARLLESPLPPADAARDPDAASHFVREGDYWSVSFGGDKTFRLRSAKGLRYLAELLANPNREIHVLDLAGVDARLAQPPHQGGHELTVHDARQDVIDPEGRRRFQARLEELAEELTEADEFNDIERASRVRSEIDALADALTAATGLSGRPRQISSEAERARTSVKKAIQSAISNMRQHCLPLAKHLDATVKTGLFCSYVPDPRVPIKWHVGV